MKNETRKVVYVILASLIVILLLFNIFNHRYTRSFAVAENHPLSNVSVINDLDSLMVNVFLNDSIKHDSVLSIIGAFNRSVITIDSLFSVENGIQRRIEQNNNAFLDKVNIWVTFWVSFIAFFLTIFPIILSHRIERNFSQEFDLYKQLFLNYEKKFEELEKKNKNDQESNRKEIEEAGLKVSDRIEKFDIKKERLNILYCYNMIDTFGTKLDYYNSDDRRSYMELMLKDAIKSTIVLQDFWNDKKAKGFDFIEDKLIVKRTLIMAISKVLIFMEGNKIKKPRVLYEQMERLKAIRYEKLGEIEKDNKGFAKVLDELRIYYRIDNKKRVEDKDINGYTLR